MQKKNLTHIIEQNSDHYQLVECMLNAYAVSEIILDYQHEPVDYRFLEVNSSFENLTGLSKKDIIGKSASEILPKTTKEWIKICGDVALNKKDICTEYYSPNLECFFHVRIRSEQRGTFITTFNDISSFKDIHEKLEKQKRSYESLFNNIRVGLIRTSIDDGNIIHANPACADIFGFDDLKSFMQSSIIDLYKDPADRRQHRAKLLRNGKLNHTTLQMQSKNKKALSISVSSTIHYENNLPAWIDSTIQDITKQQRAQERLDVNSIVFEHTLEAVVISDENHKIVTVNKAFMDITGYTKKEVLGKDFDILWCDEEKLIDEQCDMILHELTNSGSWQGEVYKRHKEGHSFPAHLSVIKGPKHYISIFYDITYRKQSEKKLYQLAHFDTLTQLSNRHAFIDRLEESLEKASRYKQKCAVFFLDLDGFKAINDAYGHTAGDEVLISVANRLNKLVRKSDMVARMGGDEFTVIIENSSDIRSLNTMAKKIISSVAEDIKLGQNSVNVTASIGISIYPDDAEDIKSIIRNADNAMYRAKELGKNTLQFFTKEMNIDLINQMIFEKELLNALQKDELKLFYQARIDSRTDKIISLELIIRWNNGTYGWVSPEDFLPVAMQSNIIYDIFSWALSNSCKEIKEYQDKYNKKISLSLSIPDKYLNSPQFIKEVIKAISLSGLEPDSLQFQVQQNTLMQENSICILKELEKIGVKIIIDNFGTGVSSIQDLENINIYGVKIDESFIKDLNKQSPSKTLLSLINLASSFEAQVITDAIGSELQLLILKNLNVAQVQGPHLYPITDSEQSAALLNEML